MQGMEGDAALGHHSGWEWGGGSGDESRSEQRGPTTGPGLPGC